jgi:hypothetical protein
MASSRENVMKHLYSEKMMMDMMMNMGMRMCFKCE